MKKLSLSIVFFFFISLSLSYAQRFKGFKSEELYLAQLDSFLGKRSEQSVEKIVKVFKENWNSAVFTAEHKTSIMLTSNALYNKRVRQYPDFVAYLATLNSFSGNTQLFPYYDSWEQCLNVLISSSSGTLAKVNDFIEISNNFFSDTILNMTASTVWKCSNIDCNFKYDQPSKALIIKFNNLDLFCISRRDTSIIYNTSGEYIPTKKKWIGHSGKINWLRAGFNENDVYANLQNYTVDLSKSEYKADSVTFYNKHYLQDPLLGRIEEKLIAGATGEKAFYPRFDSYNKRVKLKKVIENVDYDGGFSMQGARFFGTGDEQDDAILTINRDGNQFITALSKSFIFEKKGVYCDNASISIRFDKDSIHHPSLFLKIVIRKESKEVIFTRGEQGMSQSPFFNTYHKIDMEVPEISWIFNDSVVKFHLPVGSSSIKCKFESTDYFSIDKFNKLQGFDKVNPLILVRDFSKKKYSNKFYSADLSAEIRIASYQVRQLMMRLSYEGFVVYHPNTDEVVVRQRLYDYLGARVGKKDYDVLSVTSNVKSAAQNNALLNLKNHNLDIFGVDTIVFSDNRRVAANPKEKHLTLLKNRHIKFDGHLMVGLADLYGRSFYFNYDSFDVKTEQVDSMYLIVRSDTINESGYFTPIKIKSAIQQISGIVKIDAFHNKSGTKNMFQYPTFESIDTSKVFYDRATSNHDVYSQNRFYFQAFPFYIDSMNALTRRGIQIKGNFVSGGIFPEFGEILSVQKDSALGFIRKTENEGLPLFGGKAAYHNNIKLDGSGLSGDGEVRYLTSLTRSNDFIFYPDSANCIANSFKVKRITSQDVNDTSKVQYPDVKADSAYVHWEPYADKMITSSRKSPLFLFTNNDALLNGSVIVTPKGLNGLGTLKVADGVLQSKLYKFKEHEFVSDTVDFKMVSPENLKNLITTSNVKTHIDVTKKVAVFLSNSDYSSINFPLNQYLCNTNHFLWNINKHIVEIGTDITKYVDIKDFIRAKDSLFIHNDSTYFVNMHNRITTLANSDRKVSDKKLVSDNEANVDSFYVLQNVNVSVPNDKKDQQKTTNSAEYKTVLDESTIAMIDSAYNERIRKSLQFGQSKFTSTNSTQDSLSFYTGIATYNINDYVLTAKSVDRIKVADAIIFPSDNVVIEPNAKMQTLYEAKIVSDTIQRFHTFRNATVIIRGKNSYVGYGNYYYSDENKNGYTIRFANIHLDSANRTIAFGKIQERDSFKLSPNFKFFGDVIARAEDKYLTFDGYTKLIHSCRSLGQSYLHFRSVIKPDSIYLPVEEKYQNNKDQVYAGNFFNLDSGRVYSVFLKPKNVVSDSVISKATGYLHFDKENKYYTVAKADKLQNPDLSGNMTKLQKDLCFVLTEGTTNLSTDLGAFVLNVSGKTTNNIEADDYKLNTMLTVEFFFNSSSLKVLLERIEANTNLEPIDFMKPEVHRNIIEFMGSSRGEAYINDLASGSGRTPHELNKTFTFTDVRFKWDSQSRSYLSDGKIGIGYILNNPVNKYVNGKIQIAKRRGGDIINIYLEPREKTWFYFTYNEPVMKAVSSESDFNKAIEKLKDKERKFESKNKKQFSYFLGEDKIKDKFINQFVEDTDKQEDKE